MRRHQLNAMMTRTRVNAKQATETRHCCHGCHDPINAFAPGGVLSLAARHGKMLFVLASCKKHAINPKPGQTSVHQWPLKNRPAPPPYRLLSGIQIAENRLYRLLRWRRVSLSTIPALTDTFRLSTLPSIGIDTSMSQCSRVSRRMPLPSAPITQATACGD